MSINNIETTSNINSFLHTLETFADNSILKCEIHKNLTIANASKYFYDMFDIKKGDSIINILSENEFGIRLQELIHKSIFKDDISSSKLFVSTKTKDTQMNVLCSPKHNEQEELIGFMITIIPIQNKKL